MKNNVLLLLKIHLKLKILPRFLLRLFLRKNKTKMKISRTIFSRENRFFSHSRWTEWHEKFIWFYCLQLFRLKWWQKITNKKAKRKFSSSTENENIERHSLTRLTKCVWEMNKKWKEKKKTTTLTENRTFISRECLCAFGWFRSSDIWNKQK